MLECYSKKERWKLSLWSVPFNSIVKIRILLSQLRLNIFNLAQLLITDYFKTLFIKAQVLLSYVEQVQNVKSQCNDVTIRHFDNTDIRWQNSSIKHLLVENTSLIILEGCIIALSWFDSTRWHLVHFKILWHDSLHFKYTVQTFNYILVSLL